MSLSYLGLQKKLSLIAEHNLPMFGFLLQRNEKINLNLFCFVVVEDAYVPKIMECILHKKSLCFWWLLNVFINLPN